MLQEVKLLKTMTFVSNDIVTLELPKVFVAKKYQLRLKLGITVPALTSGQTYGTNVTDSPASIIKRIELRVTSDKSMTLKNISGIDLLKQAPYENQGVQENVNNIPEGTTSVSAATYYCYGSYDLNFSMPDTVDLAIQTHDGKGNRLASSIFYNPKNLTLFNPTLFNPVEIAITFGNITDLQTSNTATLSIASGEVKIYTVDLPEMSGVFAINREQYIEKVNDGANSDFRIDLPKGNFIRRIVIHSIDNSLYTNSNINNVKVVINENLTKTDIAFNALRNENCKRYQIPFANLVTGIAIVDFDAEKDTKGLLDVRRVDTVRMSLDVNAPTGTSKVRLVVQEITR